MGRSTRKPFKNTDDELVQKLEQDLLYLEVDDDTEYNKGSHEIHQVWQVVAVESFT